MAIFPFIFVRKKYKEKISKYTINHEKIHFRQQIEHLIILFFVLYLIEWIFKSYRNISFEKEAYINDRNLDYLKNRKIFASYNHL
jgi:uncharacterized protein HemY